MPGFKKVAISMPVETYRALERARVGLGQSRSEAIANAVEAWILGQSEDEASRRYIESYLRFPEVITAEDEAIVAQSVAGWDAWEPGPASRASESGATRGDQNRTVRARQRRVARPGRSRTNDRRRTKK